MATAGGHISGWMNKRPRDPHPPRDRAIEREKENQISFLGKGYGVHVENEEVEEKEGGGMDSVGEVSS